MVCTGGGGHKLWGITYLTADSDNGRIYLDPRGRRNGDTVDMAAGETVTDGTHAVNLNCRRCRRHVSIGRDRLAVILAAAAAAGVDTIDIADLDNRRLT